MLLEYFAVKAIQNQMNKENFADATTATGTTATATTPAATAPVVATTEPVKEEKGSIFGLVVFLIFFVLLAVWAVSLSWSSNTMAGWSLVPKIFFAFFAALFNMSYLMSHLLHKVDLLMVLKELKPPAAEF